MKKLLLILLSTQISAVFADSCQQVGGSMISPQISEETISRLNQEIGVEYHPSIYDFKKRDSKNQIKSFYISYCKIPYGIRRGLKDRGVSVHLTAESIVNHPAMKSQRNSTPRNHGEGGSWANLPGVPAEGTKLLIFNVSVLNINNGSEDAVLHETAHSIDYLLNKNRFFGRKKISQERDFQKLYDSTTEWEGIYRKEYDYVLKDLFIEKVDVLSTHKFLAWKNNNQHIVDDLNYLDQIATDDMNNNISYTQGHHEEHFAEAFTIFYKSPTTNNRLRKYDPELHAYFTNLERVITQRFE
tara:strand:- start:13638 stop:14534 length:897 start_codon:yes stop_codon:yes gene_type:complete